MAVPKVECLLLQCEFRTWRIAPCPHRQATAAAAAAANGSFTASCDPCIRRASGLLFVPSASRCSPAVPCVHGVRCRCRGAIVFRQLHGRRGFELSVVSAQLR